MGTSQHRQGNNRTHTTLGVVVSLGTVKIRRTHIQGVEPDLLGRRSIDRQLGVHGTQGAEALVF